MPPPAFLSSFFFAGAGVGAGLLEDAAAGTGVGAGVSLEFVVGAGVVVGGATGTSDFVGAVAASGAFGGAGVAYPLITPRSLSDLVAAGCR